MEKAVFGENANWKFGESERNAVRARAGLLKRLRSQRVSHAKRWTRSELYEDRLGPKLPRV